MPMKDDDDLDDDDADDDDATTSDAQHGTKAPALLQSWSRPDPCAQRSFAAARSHLEGHW